MATTKQEFVDVAEEIFEEFSDFLAPSLFKEQGTVNRQTGKVATPLEQTVDGIQTEVDYSLFDRRLVQVGDAMFLYRYSEFNWIPEPGNCTLTHQGRNWSIAQRMIDPAKAVVTILGRSL